MKKTYTKTVKRGAYIYYYHYNYSHSEPLTIEHVKNPEKHEWIRYTSKERHVFYEDVDLRNAEIVKPELVSKAGRPVGSKDSYQRTRSKKED